MKVFKWFLYILGALAFVGLATGAGYLGTKTKNYNPIGEDAIASGVHLSALTREELLDLNHDPAEVKININEKNGRSESIIGGDILANPLDEQAFKNLVKRRALSENNDILPISYLGRKAVDTDSLHYNIKGIDSTLASLPAVSASEVIPTLDAHGVYNKSTGEFVPVPESIGTQVDTALLTAKLQDKLNNAQNGNPQTIDLAADRLYKNPKVTMGSPELTRRVNELNEALNTVITYDYGWNSLDLTGSVFGPWLNTDDNGNIVVDKDQAIAYLKDFSEEEDIYSNKEEALKEKRVMSGYLMNYDGEVNTITQAVQTDTDTTKDLEPFKVTIDDVAAIYTAENQARLDQVKSELGNEFVYINIDEQFMWYYKNGNLVVATPVTTGTQNAHDTPVGLYYLNYKTTNVTLKGENDDGSRYESPVTYWMPFNGSVGIHDADNWRSYYGNDVYVYNGSHGCVNTPREKCEIIYDNISEECPILVE